MQCCVEEGGVQVKAVPRAVVGVGQGDLGEEFVAAPPRRPQSSERRTVAVANRGQPVVHARAVDRLGPLGRPRDQLAGARRLRVACEGAGGAEGPGVIGRRVLGERVDGDRSGGGVVGRGQVT